MYRVNLDAAALVETGLDAGQHAVVRLDKFRLQSYRKHQRSQATSFSTAAVNSLVPEFNELRHSEAMGDCPMIYVDAQMCMVLLSAGEAPISLMLVQLKVFGEIDSFIDEKFQQELKCEGLRDLVDQYTLDQLLVPPLQQVSSGSALTSLASRHPSALQACSDLLRTVQKSETKGQLPSSSSSSPNLNFNRSALMPIDNVFPGPPSQIVDINSSSGRLHLHITVHACV